MQSLIGEIYEGKVTGLTSFGAFVKMANGETGMVHISEVAATYVKDINEFLTEGQDVKVKVLAVNENRIKHGYLFGDGRRSGFRLCRSLYRILCLLLSVLLLLCACNQNFAVSGDPSSSNSERNPIISSDPSSSVMNPTTECTKHTFPKDTYVCSVCGIDYFSATLEFTLSDTRDSYIVSDVGQCTASEIVQPGRY